MDDDDKKPLMKEDDDSKSEADKPQPDSKSCYCCIYGKNLDMESETDKSQPDSKSCYCCFYGTNLDLESETDKSQLDFKSCYCCFCGDPQDGDNNVFYNRWAKNACQIFYCFYTKSKCCCTCFKIKENQWDELEPNLSRFFNSLRYFYIWLLITATIGVMLFVASIYTILSSNPALIACDSPFESYYMCPTCNRGCDFWYFKQYPFNHIPCSRRFRLLLDNPITWGYSALVLTSAFILTCCITLKKKKIQLSSMDHDDDKKTLSTGEDKKSKSYLHGTSSDSE